MMHEKQGENLNIRFKLYIFMPIKTLMEDVKMIFSLYYIMLIFRSVRNNFSGGDVSNTSP